MEQTILTEIMNALNMHSQQIQNDFRRLEEKFDQKFAEQSDKITNLEKKMDNLENRMDRLENRMDSIEIKMDKGFNRLDVKFSGMRVELTESQETIDYVATKTLQHEQKLRNMYEQQI